MRRSAPVTVPMPGEDVEDAWQRLARLPEGRSPGDLHLRLRPDGVVRLTRVHGQLDTWPSVAARLTVDEQDGVVLSGTGRPCRLGLLYLAVMLFGALACVAGAASPSAGSLRAGFAAGVVVFLLLARVVDRGRRRLRRDVDELTGLLQQALR